MSSFNDCQQGTEIVHGIVMDFEKKNVRELDGLKSVRFFFGKDKRMER
jgi:hypothetical protein